MKQFTMQAVAEFMLTQGTPLAELVVMSGVELASQQIQLEQIKTSETCSWSVQVGSDAPHAAQRQTGE